MCNGYTIDPLWSEIVEGLWQGGTDDTDVVGYHPLADTRSGASLGYFERKAIAEAGACRITRADFDSVYTLYARANGASWRVKEVRFGFDDGNMSDFSPERDLAFLVREAHRDWKEGRKVLIRCQAGWNRSGLVTALVLIRDGNSPEEAIDLIRSRRCSHALSNSIFERWLLEAADVEFWREGVVRPAGEVAA